jgi:WD40 repeat protein
MKAKRFKILRHIAVGSILVASVCAMTTLGLVGAEPTPTVIDVVAASANGRVVAASGGILKVVNGQETVQNAILVASRDPLKTLRRIPIDSAANIVRLALSHDGRFVLIVTRQFPKLAETALIFDTSSGALVKRWQDHNVHANWCVFADGRPLAIAAGADGSVESWDLGANRLANRFAGFHDSVNAVISGGEYVIAGGDDRSTRVWNVDSAMPVGMPIRHEDRVTAVAIAGDHRTAVSAGPDGAIQSWVLGANPDVKTIPTKVAATSIALSYDGTLTLIGGREAVALIGTGTGEAKWQKVIAGTVKDVSYTAFAQDANYAVVDAGYTRVYEVASGNMFRLPSARFSSARFLPDDWLIAAAEGKGAILNVLKKGPTVKLNLTVEEAN